MIERVVIVEVAMNFTACFSIGIYLYYLHRNRMRSPLESSLIFLLWDIFLLLSVRSTSWHLGKTLLLERLELTLASLIPIATLILAEGLLRRHAPLAAKIFITLGTTLFLIWTWVTHPSLEMLLGFASFLTCSIMLTTYLLFARDRGSLSSSENNLINAFMVAGLCSIPLVVSDFRQEIGYFPIRFGSIGAMLVVFIFIRNSRRDERKRAVFWDIMRFLGRGSILGTALWMIISKASRFDVTEITMAIGISLAFVLLFMIIDQVEQLHIETDRNSIQHWITREDLSDLHHFSQAIQHIPQLGNVQLLWANDLLRYDHQIIGNFLTEYGVLNLAKIRRKWRSGHAPRDQIIDLLMSHSATHICMISSDPLIVILCTLPQVGFGTVEENELRIVQKIGSLIVKGDSI